MTIIGGADPAPGGGAQNTGAQGDSALIVEGSDRTFKADVIDPSMTMPVLVDFWAPWCGPCKQLTPALEAAVAKANGAIKLVKINVDENPQIAGQLRVQSIPAVFAFVNGQPVDGFMGALPPSEIDNFIKRLSGGGPDPAEVEALLKRAQAALEAGDAGGAAQDFAALLQIDRENPDAIGGMARCLLLGGETERARELLSMVPEDKADHPAIAGARRALELAGTDVGDEDLAALVAHVTGAPRDHAKRFELAQMLSAKGDLEAAVGHLLSIVEADRDWNEGAARAEVLKLFEAAGPMSTVTKEGRKKLSTILFS
ncbi:MAG: co-chaperone YbbN [Maricaulaceae bacterium]|jgi:putative thioredoxin